MDDQFRIAAEEFHKESAIIKQRLMGIGEIIVDWLEAPHFWL